MSKNQNKSNNYSVSQNFLTSERLIRNILKIGSLSREDNVIEIGPGKGHITRQLITICKNVTAIEIDKVLYSRLFECYEGEKNLKLIHGDFLKWVLPEKPFKVFANLPFNHTSDILKKITECRYFTEGHVIVEKGAAKRFMGVPYESKASLMLKPHYDLKIVYHFKREDFHPAPSVEPVLLSIKRKANPDVEYADYKAYKRFIEKCFDNRIGINRLLTKKQISTALRLEGLPMDKRSANMLYVQWLCLFRCYKKFSTKTE